MNYEQQAIEALRAWHRVASAEFSQNMQLSFDQFLAYVKQKPNFLLDFGKSVVGTANLSGIGMAGVLRSMEDLARQAQGRVTQYEDGYPRLAEFFEALSGRALQWDVSVVKAFASDTVSKGAGIVGKAAAVALGGYTLYIVAFGIISLYVLYKSAGKPNAAAKGGA